MSDTAQETKAALRSERQVAADVLARLMIERIVQRTDRMQATAALGLTFVDVDEALQRYHRGGFIGFIGDPEAVAGSERHRRANTFTERYKRAHPEPGKRRCAACDEVKPEDEFPWRNRLQGIRHSYCSPCHTDRQRVRRLTVAKIKALNAVGLTFIVSEADELGSLACSTCGCPILPGEEVHAKSDLRHTECPTARA